jgi:uncharacterized membrane protein YjgN (DUF898 family)
VNHAAVELIYAILIVVVLLGLAGYFAYRQWQTLRSLARRPDLPPDDRRFQKAQALRRLVSSGLMVLLAAMLVGTYLIGQEHHALELGQRQALAADDGHRTPSDTDRRFLTQYGTFWMAMVLILFLLVCLAALDVLSIRRFARQQFRQIRADRRAMIDREVAELRRQRNGY